MTEADKQIALRIMKRAVDAKAAGMVKFFKLREDQKEVLARFVQESGANSREIQALRNYGVKV